MTRENADHVLVVDDDAGLRAAVTAALESVGYRVEAAEDADDAMRLASANRPALVVLDVNLPGVSGYEVCRRLREELEPPVPVIFLSGERTESFDRVAGLMLGADDYIVKPFAPDELAARVQCVLRRVSAPVAQRVSKLTRRELEVLRLLADGRNQKQIAGDLAISPKTVGTHIEHILEKLGVRSRSQAIALAYRDELLAAT